MNISSILRGAALAAALVCTIPVLAKPVSKVINITQSTKVGQTDLQAGRYRLLIDGNKVTVQRGEQILAETEGRWENRATKASYDSVLIGENGQLKEVRFSGKNRVFVVSE